MQFSDYDTTVRVEATASGLRHSRMCGSGTAPSVALVAAVLRCSVIRSTQCALLPETCPQRE